jgi:hypothetical protein
VAVTRARNRNAATAPGGFGPAFRITKTSEAVCMQAAVSELDDGGQTPVPWRLSRSVIDSVGLAGAEFARNESGMPFDALAVVRPALLWSARFGFAEIAETSVRRLLFC